MSFSQELKDFSSGFEKGWKLAKPDFKLTAEEREAAQNKANFEATEGQGALPVSPRASASTPRASTSTPSAGGGGSGKGTVTGPTDLSARQQAYIDSLMPGAIEAERETGVDRHIIVAQAAIESGWGSKAPGNNHFGIKAQPGEPSQTLMTREVINGRSVMVPQNFRVFKDTADSMRGYADFIKRNSRYKPMREAKGLDAQVEALGRSGYATEPTYGSVIGGLARSIKTKFPTTTPGAVAAPVPQPASVVQPVPPARPASGAVSHTSTTGGGLYPPGYSEDVGGTEEETEEGASFAEGGVVEPLPAKPAPRQAINIANTEAAGSNPAVRDIQEGRGADYNPKDFVDLDGAAEAVDGGLKYLSKVFGFDKQQPALPQADERNNRALMAWASNTGAATPDEVEQIKDTVDPQRKLSEDERHIAAYNASYRYWMKAGYPARAQRAAAAMLMASKRAVSQAGAMAQTAAENGDLEGAARAITIAGDHIPDGNTVRATPNGAGGLDYEIVDSNGNITDKGKASLDDVVQMATGMRNGTQWFQSLGMLRTRTVDKAAQRQEAERAGVEDFERIRRAPDGSRFIDTLDPDEKDKFLKLTPRAQAEYQRTHSRERSEVARNGRYIDRQDATDERRREDQGLREGRDKNRMALRLLSEELRQNRFDIRRSDALDKDQRREALREKEADDRDKRFEQTQEAIDRRDAERAKRILERDARRDAQRGAAGSRTRSGAGGSRSAGTAEERAAERANTETAGKLRAIDDAPYPQVRGSEGASYEREQRRRDPSRQAVVAGGAFNKASTRKGAEFDDDDHAAIRTDIVRRWDVGKERAGYKPLDENEQLTLSEIGTDIRRANNISTDRAAQIAVEAQHPSTRPQVLQDGRVRFAEHLPPVFVSEDAMLRLAQVRGSRSRGVTSDGNPVGRSGGQTEGVPTASGLPPRRSAVTLPSQEDDARERRNRTLTDMARNQGSEMMREEAKRRIKSREEEDLRKELGDRWWPGMTLPDARRELALMQQKRRALRIER